MMLDFGNAWIWIRRDDSACRVRTSWTTWGVCLIRVLQSSWVNQYQMDGFMHRTNTCRHSQGSKWMRFTMVHICIWLKNNTQWWNMLALTSLVVYFVSIISNVQLNVCRHLLLGWRTILNLTGLFVSYGPMKNSSLSPSRPERADAVVDQGTCMALMGTYVCLNGW
jgi:hypothetical protein